MEITKLITEPLPDGRKSRLYQDYIREINGYCITVPKGFITDGASVPRIFWTLFPPQGKYTPAAIIHDFLYSECNDTGINRTLADRIFLHIMKELGVSFLKRTAMYRAVRNFGESSWKPKIKNEGYKDVAIIDHTEEALKYYKSWYEILKL
ncbi:DUF1353 domain-containing protein [Fusobacterium necrophorum]|uniref:DUF1353 domain-containing protein n=1 Tax=Fusobacterium necrophorum TaxID=859 RepID=UPI00078846BF|nr:DUF1353 domain-containing protein [Fusobacterium necrophorum]AYV94403.1 DUF1353 domain-containing protein [Fusobacterium necrophorum subsp. funduliforme]KYL04247.1 hypothetical protein A2J06_01195 [Fusobacterium necrophorum subsp. funduliforme]KYM45761.1 hypothetical protein A2U15_04975 [Fusobacterium necrophorum subsp. funduliforme]KYM50419.1 hypothetical protein A2U11_01190 [Fusobacterium necrophorum subsp. funduliforme]KYM51082.1 hypothetical protein A2U04_01710 [Fusobacterium necrophoru